MKERLTRLLDIAYESKEYGVIKQIVNLIEDQTQEIYDFERILQKFEVYGNDAFGISKVDELLAKESSN